MTNFKEIMTGSLAIIIAAGSVGTISSLAPTDNPVQAYEIQRVSEKFALTGDISEALDEKRVLNKTVEPVEVQDNGMLSLDKNKITSQAKPKPKPKPKPVPKPAEKSVPKLEPKTEKAPIEAKIGIKKAEEKTNASQKHETSNKLLSKNKPYSAPKKDKEPELLDLPDRNDGRPAGKTPSSARALAKLILAERGMNDASEFSCLNSLWNKESSWSYKAANPVSSARGIPQALMSAHFGGNWRNSDKGLNYLSDPETQINWGLDYIKRTYGKPCAAWSHSQQKNWY